MRRIFLLLFVMYLGSAIEPRANPQTDVTSAQVNGTWETKNGEFKIWALGHQMLRIEFSGSFEYKSPDGRDGEHRRGPFRRLD